MSEGVGLSDENVLWGEAGACSHECGGLEEAGHDGIRQQFIAATTLYRDQSVC